jgi:hypothetical protein
MGTSLFLTADGIIAETPVVAQESSYGKNARHFEAAESKRRLGAL